jgi:seryl-tRNA synthetase
VDELQAVNEELRSINEEQKAATEELETSREEIQSINEELTTINQEHQSTIEELKRTNTDLQNLIESDGDRHHLPRPGHAASGVSHPRSTRCSISWPRTTVGRCTTSPTDSSTPR